MSGETSKTTDKKNTPAKRGVSETGDAEQEKTTPTPGTSKRLKTDNRTGYDYWKLKEPYVEPLAVSLRELEVGKISGKFVLFRVTMKSHKKPRHFGPMLEFYCIDASGEASVSVFPKFLDKFYDLIQVNCVYRMENFEVRTESIEYPSGAGLPNTLSVIHSTTIEQLADDYSVPQIPFAFVKLRDLLDKELQSKQDAVGIIVEMWEVETTAGGHLKRDIAITDDTKTTVMLTLWHAPATTFSAKLFDSVVIRRAKLGEYNELRCLNTRNETLVWVESDLQEALDLKKWFEEANNDQQLD